MAISKIILLIALLQLVHNISLLVNSDKERCMVVYALTDDESLKIDMKFQRFPGQSRQQGYRITLTNTENGEIKTFDVQQGVFRKEVNIPIGIIFNLCIKIMLDRYGGSEINKYVQYNTRVRAHTNIQASKIIIPSNFLAVKDLKQSYTHLSQFKDLFPYIKEAAKEVKNEEDAIFQEQKGEIQKIEWLSIIEIAAICIFGVYQFFKLKSIIDNRHNK